MVRFESRTVAAKVGLAFVALVSAGLESDWRDWSLLGTKVVRVVSMLIRAPHIIWCHCVALVELIRADRKVRSAKLVDIMMDFPEKSPETMGQGCVQSDADGALARIRAEARAINRVASRLSPRFACLHRSIALWQWMQREGLVGKFCIGVNREDGGMAAHAWIEVAGKPVNEDARICREHVKLVPLPIHASPSGMSRTSDRPERGSEDM